MTTQARLGLFILNIILLMTLLFVRLERQQAFIQLQQVTKDIQHRQLLYNTTIVEYYKKMSLVTLEAKGDGYALPSKLPPWVKDTPI
ncbi:hypothetical protein OAT84_02570 [Gammaproteobacteria bacterium]|nr:hypothetical protein [Gammaproteobacteria bacterium]